VLPDCFLLPPGSTALDFAYHLHSDIGDKFVKAIDVRTKTPVGKDHQKNRHFRNVGVTGCFFIRQHGAM